MRATQILPEAIWARPGSGIAGLRSSQQVCLTDDMFPAGMFRFLLQQYPERYFLMC